MISARNDRRYYDARKHTHTRPTIRGTPPKYTIPAIRAIPYNGVGMALYYY